MSIIQSNQKKTLSFIFISYILICAVWAVYRFFIDKPMTAYFQSNILAAALLEGLIKSLILIVPSIILMKLLEDDLLIPPKSVFSFNGRTLLFGLGLSALFFTFYSLRNVLNGGVRYSLAISVDELTGAVFFAAITEEIMYRGFILNALVKKFGREWANVITAVMFALMHLPIWIADGRTGFLDLVPSLFSTACIGYLLGLLLLHTGVIWGAVIAHALHNFIVHIIRSS